MSTVISTYKGGALTVIGTVLALGLTASVTARGNSSQLFTGAGFGPTADVAVQAATWDAEASAGAEGLYTCAQVGEASIFQRSNSARGSGFAAEVTLECTR